MTERHPKDDSQTTKEGITINPTEESGVDAAGAEDDAQEDPEEEVEEESGLT